MGVLCTFNALLIFNGSRTLSRYQRRSLNLQPCNDRP
jgi:hypothetical protein